MEENTLNTNKIAVNSLIPVDNNELTNDNLNIVKFYFVSKSSRVGNSYVFTGYGILSKTQDDFTFGNTSGQYLYQTVISETSGDVTLYNYQLIPARPQGTPLYPFYHLHILSINSRYVSDSNGFHYLRRIQGSDYDGTILINDKIIFNVVFGKGLIYGSNSTMDSSNKISSVYILPGRSGHAAMGTADSTADYGITIDNITSNNAQSYRMIQYKTLAWQDLYLIQKPYGTNGTGHITA